MIEKLKNSPDGRQALTIGAGVFGGLMAMRLTMAAYHFADDQHMVGAIAVLGAIALLAAAIYFGLRKLYRKLEKRGKQNFRQAIYAACFFGLLAGGSGVALHLRAQRLEEERQAQREHARYLQFAKQHPEWKGSESDWVFLDTLPDKN